MIASHERGRNKSREGLGRAFKRDTRQVARLPSSTQRVDDRENKASKARLLKAKFKMRRTEVCVTSSPADVK